MQITMRQFTGKQCILFFLKAPEEGKVKSRLAEVIGGESACRLYKYFIMTMLETLNKVSEEESLALKLCFHPPEAKGLIMGWLGSGYDYMPQQGEDLGQRMKNAFQECFAEGYDSALLLGSDIPDLPVMIIKEGFCSLINSDAVIGPAYDGGYYLIGFRSDTFLPEVFEGISWSTDNVFQKTMEICAERDLIVATLPRWRDIDTYEDLQELVRQDINN
jgi:hypothetical protein